MAQAIYKALTDQAFRLHCQAMASAVAEQFSAQTMIEQTMSVYELAANQHAIREHSQRMSFV
jgi:glycosyltransferase involved in cell wall biosynthesis